MEDPATEDSADEDPVCASAAGSAALARAAAPADLRKIRRETFSMKLREKGRFLVDRKKVRRFSLAGRLSGQIGSRRRGVGRLKGPQAPEPTWP
jgi:hypothetical protein